MGELSDMQSASSNPTVDRALWSLVSDGAIVVDPALVILAANTAAERLLGHREPDLVGTSILTHVVDGERDGVATQLNRSVGGEPCHGFATTLHYRGSALAPVSLSTATLPDGRLLVVARDRTEEVESQQMLIEADAALADGEALARFGLWVWDVESDVVQWSAGVHQLTGVPPHEFEGTLEAHLAVVHVDDRVNVRAALDHCRRNSEPLDLSHRINGADGALVHVATRAQLTTSSDGAVVALRGVCQDVTQARLVEELLRTAAEREHDAADLLREADAAKDEFLATVSHELRTPITVVTGFLDLMTDSTRSLDPTMRDDIIARMHRSAVDLRDMVERLLDFSRLQAGRMEVSIDAVPLAALTRRIVGRLGPLFDAREVSVSVPADAIIAADVNAVEHIVSNLLTNASKYSDDGTTITISATSQPSTIELRIADQGRGIAPDQLDRVFDRFYRIPGGTGKERGTGVGLAVVRQYVDLIDATMSVTSEFGVGSTFSVIFQKARQP